MGTVESAIRLFQPATSCLIRCENLYADPVADATTQKQRRCFQMLVGPFPYLKIVDICFEAV